MTYSQVSPHPMYQYWSCLLLHCHLQWDFVLVFWTCSERKVIHQTLIINISYNNRNINIKLSPPSFSDTSTTGMKTDVFLILCPNICMFVAFCLWSTEGKFRVIFLLYLTGNDTFHVLRLWFGLIPPYRVCLWGHCLFSCQYLEACHAAEDISISRQITKWFGEKLKKKKKTPSFLDYAL